MKSVVPSFRAGLVASQGIVAMLAGCTQIPPHNALGLFTVEDASDIAGAQMKLASEEYYREEGDGIECFRYDSADTARIRVRVCVAEEAHYEYLKQLSCTSKYPCERVPRIDRFAIIFDRDRPGAVSTKHGGTYFSARYTAPDVDAESKLNKTKEVLNRIRQRL